MNSTPVGTFSVSSSAKKTVPLSIGTAAAYELVIQPGTGTPSDLVVSYAFNETGGTAAAEASGNGNHASVSGGS
ncbi:hypothetical protein J7E73_24870 [Paenibacillus albidus]|uniref:hypothetical protein n=1 Tax=Paenibacillus albidus TaxID=2041023 RepID=UPI001BEB1C73|nr:hypothetical protein [Paenibacillus albidus]MBT2292301.1 hypothetical protein [Paenibacillus albidus]